MDDNQIDGKHSTRKNYSLSTYTSSMNLMKFVEISPIDSFNIPHPRSGHRAVATESDLWIWGGYHPSMGNDQPRMFNELWRFNYALRRWTLEPTTGLTPSFALASHSMCLYGNSIFVFGGTGFPFGQNVSNELHVLDLKQRHWRKCELLNQQPEHVYGPSMVINKEHLYILCGTNSFDYNSNVYDIHLRTLVCTKIGSTFDEIESFTEGGRYRQEVYLYNNQIYLFGGGSASGTSFSLENLPVFDLNTYTWSFIRTNPDPLHNFPSARKFHSVFPFSNNKIIIFGGADFDQTEVRHVAANEYLWTFDFEKSEWAKLPNLTLPKPAYFHAAAINKRGEIWMHGGIVQRQNEHERDTRITTLYKMNVKVLKLGEICWDHFLNSLTDRINLIKRPNFIKQFNIPARYAERIY